MFNVGGGELLVILLLALIILGPQRLPTAARTVGRVMGDLRRMSSGFQQELKDAFDDSDAPTPLRRKESVPLAATVADADRADTKGVPAGRRPDQTAAAASAPAVADGSGDQRDAASVEAAGSEPAAVEPAPADDSTVAPAVAAALDEIVTPLATSAGTPPAATADAPEGPGDDATGDARAAS